MLPGGARGSSKRVQVVLVLFCVALHTSSAFLSYFLGPRKTPAVGPIDADCVSKALDVNCSFYQCFNERHPCGDSENYAVNYGWRFCSRFDAHRNRLTAEGQRWLKAARNCSMVKILKHYRENAISCSAVQENMREAHADCESTHGLCRGRLIADNKEVLADVYTVSLNSGSQFLYSLEKCAMAQVSDAVTWLSARLLDFQGTGETVAQSVHPIVNDIRGQARNMGENVAREFSGWGTRLLNIGRLLFGSGESDDQARRTV